MRKPMNLALTNADNNSMALSRAGTRYSSSGLHFFVIHARKRSAGAYVSCWINFRLGEGALELAKFYVRNEGWRIRSVTEKRWIERVGDVPVGSRQYFKEAKKDGASFIFHRYPIKRK